MNKKYFYAKDLDDAKYKCLINKRKSAGLKHFNDPKALSCIQMIFKIFTKILKNTIWVKDLKY